MTILENITTTLSTKKYRIGFIILALILLLLISYSILGKTFPDIWIFKIQYDVSNILDYVQLLIVISSLIFLFFVTDKSEINRYIENHEFYSEKYSKLKNKIIRFDELYSCSVENYTNIGLSKSELKKIKLNNIIFHLTNDFYTLPSLIEEQFRDIIIKKFNIQEKNDYNALTLSLRNIQYEVEKGSIKFTFHKAYYFQALVTNLIPEYEIIKNLTVRDFIESPNMRTINSLEDSLAVNHLGISCLLSFKYKSRDYYLIPKRGNNTAVFKGQLSPSISGAANIFTCRDIVDNTLSIRKFFDNEFEEEISTFLDERIGEDLCYSLKNDILNNLFLVGITRELKRLGKPELFFFYDTKFILDNYIETTSKINGVIEIKITNKKDATIDYSENEKFFLIDRSIIKTLIKEKSISSSTKSSYKQQEKYYIIKILEEEFKISESLFVNLALTENFS